jgi:hypothetical protein
MRKLFSLFVFVLLAMVVSTMSSCKRSGNRFQVVELSDSTQIDTTSVYDEEYGDTIEFVDEETVEEPKPAPAPSNTFQSASDVLNRLAGKTFVHRGGMEIRIRGGRMSFDHQDAGTISVLHHSGKNALIRFRGGMFGEGRYRVRIVGRYLQLIDDEEGFVFDQR